MQCAPLIAALFVLVSPAWAGETPWQEVAPGVKLRLISTGEVRADGSAMLGLEIDMPATTKTYWRVPGDTGLPTKLDWTGSVGITGGQIHWPYPSRSETADYLDYVYFGPTVLPIEVSVDGAEPVVELSALLGICSDICMPAQARFSLPLKLDAPDRANGLRIRQALAAIPVPWDGSGDPIAAVQLGADGESLDVRIADPAVEPDSLIAATASGEPLFGSPQSGAEPGLVLVPVRGEDGAADLHNETIELTFMTSRGPYVVVRKVEGPQTLEE